MIYGHGIDLQEISAIRAAYQKKESFATKVLTSEEYIKFKSLPERRAFAYLAGRWAAKEAFAKAMGTGFVNLSFTDIEILTNEQGAPVVTKSPFAGRVHVSISHSDNYVQASVILEEKES